MDRSSQTVLLVSPTDEPLGHYPKLQAHTEGKLHRAFSVFLLDGQGNMLLQRRAKGKYHSGGLWTNACCSHPMENVLEDAKLRMVQELGVEIGHLKEVGSFVYRHVFENGMTEYEFDHVLLGTISRDTPLSPDPDEADATEWIGPVELAQRLTHTPEIFTPWFLTAAPMVLEYLK